MLQTLEATQVQLEEVVRERDEARAEVERLRETARQLLESWTATREMLRKSQAAVKQTRAQLRKVKA